MQAKSFFGSLFDYSFSSFITPRIIKILYVLATIVISLWTLFLIVAAFNVSDGAGGGMLLIGGPLFFLFSMIYARVFLELVIAFFRINGNVQEIRDERIGGAPQPAPSLGPSPEDAPVVAPAETLPEIDDARSSPHPPPASRRPDPRRRAVRRAGCCTGIDTLLRELRRGAPARRTLLHQLRSGVTHADLRELRQRRAGGFPVLRELRRAVRAGRSADRRHGCERQGDADLSELRQRGARGRAVLRELQRAPCAG